MLFAYCIVLYCIEDWKEGYMIKTDSRKGMGVRLTGIPVATTIVLIS